MGRKSVSQKEKRRNGHLLFQLGKFEDVYLMMERDK